MGYTCHNLFTLNLYPQQGEEETLDEDHGIIKTLTIDHA